MRRCTAPRMICTIAWNDTPTRARRVSENLLFCEHRTNSDTNMLPSIPAHYREERQWQRRTMNTITPPSRFQAQNTPPNEKKHGVLFSINDKIYAFLLLRIFCFKYCFEMFCNEDNTLHFTYCFPPHYIHATQGTRSSMFMQFWNRLALSTRIFKQTTCGVGRSTSLFRRLIRTHYLNILCLFQIQAAVVSCTSNKHVDF